MSKAASPYIPTRTSARLARTWRATRPGGGERHCAQRQTRCDRQALNGSDRGRRARAPPFSPRVATGNQVRALV